MQKIKVCSLFSGSSANSSYIEINGRGILIDIGSGIKNTLAALSAIGSGLDRVDAIFITHEHVDHIRGLSAICNRYHIPVIANQCTLNAILRAQPNLNDDLLRPMPTGAKAVRNEFEVSSFASSHDSAESVGYIIRTEKGNIGVLTDLGEYTDDTIKTLSLCNTLILEANHDVDMLWNGKYPYILKRRVASSKGHLSNLQCGNLLSKIVHKGVKNVLLAHLSQENNTPQLALTTVSSIVSETGALVGGDVCVSVAPRSTVSKIFEV